MEIRKLIATSADKTPADSLVEYFAMQLKPSTTVGSEHKKQMTEEIIRILTPLVQNDKTRQKTLEKVAEGMVRDCVAIASSEDPTIKLSFGQRIRRVVVESLESLFGLSKEKREFRDIVAGQDFATALKGRVVSDAAGSPPVIPTPKAVGSSIKR